MIHVENLTKYYGDYAAIENVGFDVPAGKIVGFLGPNGAGKSTTMRILTGYLTPTSGVATIDGLDVFWDAVEARRRIGYMPENCPLYTEMRVQEFLHFRGGIKGIYGNERHRRIGYVLERCKLTEVSRQIIGTLSKGYRQRVGLADALLASPKVLILDEPTSGLDPTQIRSTRALIRELGKEHTILLSTHILSEVEMTCDSVIIINKGRVAASDSLAGLAQKAGQQSCLVAELEGVESTDALEELPGVTAVEREPSERGVRLRLHGGDVDELVPRVCTLAVQQGWKVHALHPERQTLEDLFVKIVGRQEATVS